MTAAVFDPIKSIINIIYVILFAVAAGVLLLFILSKRDDWLGRLAGVMLEVFAPKFAPRRQRARLERSYRESPPTSSETYDFKVVAHPYFFEKAERTFYRELMSVAGQLGIEAFPKVGLNDVFEDRPGAEPGQYARYSQQHVDFLLVSRQTGRIVAGIELDGPSHRKEKQQANDRKKVAVFKAANIPLLRFYNREHFDAGEIKGKLEDVLGTSSISTSP